MKIMMREGFWWSKCHKLFPKPVPHEKPWKGKGRFLKALSKIERKADDTARRNATKGWSNCRCCGCKNGGTTFEYQGWRWPDGFRHYVEKHNVRPSLAFQEFVLGTYLETD